MTPHTQPNTSNTTYELHEFDPDRTFTGEINPEAISSVKFLEYQSNEIGTKIIDKNKDLSTTRRLISLQTKKITQSKFDRVINTDFEEFVDDPIDETLPFRQRIEELEIELAGLLAAQSSDLARIQNLSNQINSLEEQIELVRSSVSLNDVPDTLTANSKLYSDRTGLIGAPGYPMIQNRLLSRNRKALALLRTDGILSIYTGQFDSLGNSLPNVPRKLIKSFGRNYVGEQGVPTERIETTENIFQINPETQIVRFGGLSRPRIIQQPTLILNSQNSYFSTLSDRLRDDFDFFQNFNTEFRSQQIYSDTGTDIYQRSYVGRIEPNQIVADDQNQYNVTNFTYTANSQSENIFNIDYNIVYPDFLYSSYVQTNSNFRTRVLTNTLRVSAIRIYAVDSENYQNVTEIYQALRGSDVLDVQDVLPTGTKTRTINLVQDTSDPAVERSYQYFRIQGSAQLRFSLSPGQKIQFFYSIDYSVNNRLAGPSTVSDSIWLPFWNRINTLIGIQSDPLTIPPVVITNESGVAIPIPADEQYIIPLTMAELNVNETEVSQSDFFIAQQGTGPAVTRDWTKTFTTGPLELSNDSRIVLDDNGYLILYDGNVPRWSSFGK